MATMYTPDVAEDLTVLDDHPPVVPQPYDRRTPEQRAYDDEVEASMTEAGSPVDRLLFDLGATLDALDEHLGANDDMGKVRCPVSYRCREQGWRRVDGAVC